MQHKYIISRIVSERSFFMGIAIIFVILYHIPSTCVHPVIKSLFYPGFIGVDFFLFYSAYGLSHSVGKHTLKEFYHRRFCRVLPLFFILSISKSLMYVADGNILSAFDWLCNLTSLSFYEMGGFIFDWYLCFLLLLYLVFPPLKNGIDRLCDITNRGQYLPDTLWLTILAIFAIWDLNWQYETAIGRLPIFTLGILCTKADGGKYYKHAIISFTAFFAIAVLLFFKNLIHTYVLVYLLAPSVLFILADILFTRINFSDSKIYLSICKIGKITLELYVANNISLSIMNYAPTFIPKIGTYIASNIILSAILVYANKFVTNRINTWQKNDLSGQTL